ncbi:MAG: Glutamate-tRNA ligase [Parcubacteria group bacterium GW2011_GWC1_35_8]|nr:MAG: Glutamate-tRNA ligase [Parcubacteria group bacterium GW2011_GWC1_35_8]
MSDTKVVTRFAPSLTGFMHVGGVRTALFAWLFARKNKGTFILRIEDTDKAREVAGSIDHIIESLKWIGIDWDEGPDIGGPHAPYKQSERLDSYKKYAQILIEKGLAYPDPYTSEELEAFRKKAEVEKRPFLYRDYRPESFRKWDGTKALRFKTPEIKSYKWTDAVRGELSAGPEALDDFILIKSDGYPTYNFAHIIDDLEMGVTHIMRADEFISSTPKFLSLYDALSIMPPVLVTLPPILGEAGTKKLGKRDGAKDILDYKKEGYLPEAMLNFLAFIGWNPGEGDNREVLTKEEIINFFDLKHVQRAGGKFNEEKLIWLNKEHMKKLSQKEIEKNIFEYLPSEIRNPKLIPVIFDRISKWSDVKEMVAGGEFILFFKAPQINKIKLIYKKTSQEKITENLKLAIKSLESLSDDEFITEKIKEVLIKIADGLESRGELLHPVRYALSGKDQSPDPFIIASIIGKNETLSRLQKAI